MPWGKTTMRIKHHLTEQLLMGYAASTLPEAFNLVVASHISMCDDCRAALAAYEALGGAMLEDSCAEAAETDLSPGSFGACLARLDTAPADRDASDHQPAPPAPAAAPPKAKAVACGEYRVDVTAARFGDCKNCGLPKKAHQLDAVA
ncbi:MAG: hypothetical protein VXW43_12055, partial [Pseudomonadota bacterium]|nr:hypothetical protein [Pseudomonadota bacterium]